jgi:autotransporter family porin
MNLPSFRKTHIAQAVAFSAAVLASMPVLAQGACVSNTANTISDRQTTACYLSSGGSLNVTSPNGIIEASGPGVYVSVFSSPFSIINAGSISGTSGGITVAGSYGASEITNSGTISSGGKGAALALNNSSNPFAVNNTGTISGTINLGINTLNLDGASGVVEGYIYGGSNSVINVNGTLNRTEGNYIGASQINIASGGTLHLADSASIYAHSTIGGGFANSGTLSVAPEATASISGTYTQSAAGVFQTAVASDTSYGKLLLNNSTTLPASAKINVDVIGSPALTLNHTLTEVIKVDGETYSYSGDCDPCSVPNTLTTSGFAVSDNSSLFNFVATQNGNAVDLTIVAGTTALQSVNTNNNTASQGAAAVLDSLTNSPGNMAPVITALGQLSTGGEVSDAVKKTLPLMTTSVKQAGFTSLRTTDRVIQSRMESNHGLSAGDSLAGDRQVWVKPVGSWADQKDLDGVSGYKATSSGIVFGADNAVSAKVRAGGAFSYTNSRIDSNSATAPNSAKVDTYRLIGYGSYSLDDTTDINVQADVGFSDIKGDRTVNFAGLTHANSDYKSWNTHVAVGMGRNLPLNATTTFTPSVNLSYAYMQDAAYTESGNVANHPLLLQVGKNSSEELVAYAEGKLTHTLSESTKLIANLGAGYDFMAKQNSLAASYVGGGGQFVTNGLNVAPWSVRAGVGLVSQTKTLEITARYDLEMREGSNNQTVSIKFRMPF